MREISLSDEWFYNENGRYKSVSYDGIKTQLTMMDFESVEAVKLEGLGIDTKKEVTKVFIQQLTLMFQLTDEEIFAVKHFIKDLPI